MNKIDITFLKKNGWQEFLNYTLAPKNCFYKNTYPVALWWDEIYDGFWVIDFNKITPNPVLVTSQLIQTEKEYDDLIIPIIQLLEYEQRKKFE